MRIFLIIYIICFSLVAEDITLKKYNSIINGKITKTIRPELKFITPISSALLHLSIQLPNNKIFEYEHSCNINYIDGKYIKLALKNAKENTYFIIGWNDKTKTLIQWKFNPKTKALWTFHGKCIKDNKYSWKGKSNIGETYKGRAEYSKNSILFEGKYYKDKKLLQFEYGLTHPYK